MVMCYQGNTVRLRAVFTDWSGIRMDPTGITLTVYTSDRKMIGDPIPINSEHRVSEGVYEYDYTLPIEYDMLAFEFRGIDSDGHPILARQLLSPIWAE